MNISALWVFGFAVMAAYGYMEVPCTDCSNPCYPHQLSKAIEDFKLMNISETFCEKYNNISDKANPTWECKQSQPDIYRTPQTYHEAHCGKCKNRFEMAHPIKQDVMMLIERSCPSTYNHNFTVLEVKQVKVSLGCTCVRIMHGKRTF